jgi:predicted AlkP superfamily pyrophosphatase or phosphodiesterase
MNVFLQMRGSFCRWFEGGRSLKSGTESVLTILFFTLAGILPATATFGATEAEPGPSPRLVLIIAVDQLRADYLERFSHLFLPARKGKTYGGFRFLMERGAHHLDAHHDHYPTATGPGHAALVTGAFPYMHGIVGNSWFDRKTGENRNCVLDKRYPQVGGAEEGRPVSPSSMLVTTLGDQLKMATGGRAKVWGIAFKDRSASLSAGHLADGALWLELSSARWVTSTFYAEEGLLPAWVESWNRQKRAEAYFGKSWKLSVPESALKLVWPDGVLQESAFAGMGTAFPHQPGAGEDEAGPEFYRAFPYTPFGIEFFADSVMELAERESMGADKVTDLLTVGFSTADYAGHVYGPDSPEILDIIVSIDRQLSRLLNHLDGTIPGGLSQVTIVLSADHGVAPVIAAVREVKLPAGFVGYESLKKAVDGELDARFGEANWLADMAYGGVYLDYDVIRSRDLNRADVEDVAAEAIMSRPGMQAAYTRTRILEGRIPDTKIARLISRSFHPERSGDVIFAGRPYWIGSRSDEGSKTGATHGSPHSYDTQVPLIFAGWGITPGRYGARVSVLDAAPTLAALLKILPPNGSEGRVLGHVLGLD